MALPPAEQRRKRPKPSSQSEGAQDYSPRRKRRLNFEKGGTQAPHQRFRDSLFGAVADSVRLQLSRRCLPGASFGKFPRARKFASGHQPQMSNVLSDQQAKFGHDQPRVFVLRGGREEAKVANLIF
jgi:hypothetical protein